MSPLRRQTTLALGMLVLIIVLVANGLIISNNVATLREHQGWVQHTNVVIATLEEILARSASAESDARGFLLTHERAYFVQVPIAQKDAWKSFEDVRALTVDNSVQVENCKSLESLLSKRFALMNGTLGQAGKPANLLKLSIGNGQEAMDAFRRNVDRMKIEEKQLLTKREATSARAYGTVQTILVIITTLNILFVLLIYLLVRTYLKTQADFAEEQAREARLRTTEAEASQLVSGDKSLKDIAKKLVDFTSTGVGVPGANLFVIEDGHLHLIAGYGQNELENQSAASQMNPSRHGSRNLNAAQIVPVGEGLVGTSALAETMTEINDVPPDYFHLRSSFGESAPKHLIFVPLRFQKVPIALIELASFSALNREQREWIETAGKAFSIGINAAVARHKQQDLLEETQRQGEELQAQQEELQTNNEELQEQTQALLHSQERLQVQQEELQQINEELEQQTRALESQREALNIRNQDLEVAKIETETKARELEKASQYKSEFLAKMSHELRTPLNSLMILATLLHENRAGNLTTQQVDFARTIFESGGDLLNLINDILDLSKLEARKLAARPEKFLIDSFVEQIRGLFKPLLQSKELDFIVNVSADAPKHLFTDRQRMQQILRNLVSNAIKFTDRGTVTMNVELGNRAGFIQVSVIDTGVGIPVEKKQLIFDAFEQADGSVSRKYGGTGLGLTISRELANLLQGQISVESEAGKGSTFTLEIPIELQQRADDETPDMRSAMTMSMTPSFRLASDFIDGRKNQSGVNREQNNDQNWSSTEEEARLKLIVDGLLQDIEEGARTILVVEDDDKFRASVAEATRGFGFTPISVGDGETALAVLKCHTPRAILLDIRLPGMNGLTVLETVKENPQLRHVPIHMISAMEHQQSALRMGAVGYLGKPVTIDGVRSALLRIEDVISRSVKRLLVVEDDERQRNAIAELVEGQDLEILTVGTGAAAIQALASSVIDCVILDLSLPDCSGFELLENLNDRDDISLPPVIIYTGKDLSKAEEDRLRRYSDSIIIKGAKSPERLLDEVSLFLHRVDSALPEDKRAMLADLRQKDRAFDGCQVLIVDDDLRNVFALTSALETRGFKVHVARNGLEALESLAKLPKVDVVLMDIMMPKMDGFEAMRKIRENSVFKKLPIIALTAKTMKGEYERCIEAGASDYLPKPINLAMLLSVLKVWVPTQGIMQ